MTEYETILSMIEEVDPSDVVKLDEIDIRVICWIRNREWGGWHGEGHTATGSWAIKDGKRVDGSYANHSTFPRLSRSRDALKEIRPEGWAFEIKEYPKDWRACLSKGNFMKRVCGSGYKTEQLAELHVIIQAISF